MKNKKQIALVLLGDFFFDARSINMVLSLQKENYKVSVISNFKNLIQHVAFKKTNFHQIQLSKKNYLKYWDFYKKVKNILKHNEYDTIIAGDLYALGAVASCKTTNSIIYDCREIYFELAAHINKPIHKYFNYLYEKHHLKRVNRVLVTAETDLKLLKKTYKQHEHLNWHIIYNFPHNAINKIDLSKHSFKHFIPKNNIKIIYQGVLQKGRGVNKLIDLAGICPFVSVLIVGEGENKKNYLNYYSEKNVNDNVFFIGAVPYMELLNITAGCDIGWAVINKRGISNEFALPNKLFEYIVSGIPVLASNLYNIKKVIDKWGVGEIIKTDSLENCKELVLSIYNNRGDYQKNIYSASKHLHWGVQHNRFIGLFDE